MTADSQWVMQQAIYTALRADATLQSLVSNPVRVFDHTPQDSELPYIVIGEGTASDFDTKDTDGMDQSLTIHTWSDYRGLSETKQIMGAVVDALDKAALSVTGHTLALLRFVGSNTLLDPDGLTRHGVQNFRAVTEIV